ncbi:glycosyltransferase [Natribaculum luteum]|uniref:Glycosyltransferase n=1 Tax=Natribaculum luteum TaxID=1586232 RepID=A0ABD5NV47_9EURY|nr:glycosyltransferase [Natribaculum luteum]
MTRVLWLTPNKPENISVGRARIASHLEENGFNVDLRAGRPWIIREIFASDDEYDAIIGTTRAGAIVGLVVSTVTGLPLVVDHVDPIRQLEETSVWPIAQSVRHLENLAFRKSAHTLYVYSEEKTRVQRHATTATKSDLGVEYNRFADPDARILDIASDRLEKFDLRKNVVIYVGGLEPIYHIRELVESIYYLDDWSLVVLGSGSLEPTVTDAAANSDRIIYLGTVPHEHVPGYLHAADVGVSLVDDPHTLKVLEYGAARLPTVQLSGRAEKKFDGTVEFCEAESASIAAAIERANDVSETTIDSLQKLAAEYSWERIAGEYSNVLRSL